MIESAFNMHLECMLVLGALFVYLMNRLGRRDCVEKPLKKHLGLKIVGIVMIVIGIAYVVMGFIYLSLVECPSVSLPQVISAYTHVRQPDAFLHIGYRTTSQALVINSFYGAIQFTALGTYLLSFKKSGTNWWQKTLKVLAYIALFLLLPSVLDFHYFDLYEFITPIIWVLLITACLINWKKLGKHDDKMVKDDIGNGVEEKVVVIEESVSQEREINITDVKL